MISEKFRTGGRAKARYVKKAAVGEFYLWCEQSADDPRYDVAQGEAEASDLPDDIRAKCDAYDGVHYACEWPMGEGEEV